MHIQRLRNLQGKDLENELINHFDFIKFDYYILQQTLDIFSKKLMPIYSHVQSFDTDSEAKSLIDELVVEYNEIYIEVLECTERLNAIIAAYIRMKKEEDYITFDVIFSIADEIKSLVDTFYILDRLIFTFERKTRAIIGASLLNDELA